jgi:hypothetical protein
MKSFLICLLAVSLIVVIPVVARGEIKSGEIALQAYGSSSEVPIAVKIGDKLQATCRFSITNFFHGKAVSARADLENTSQDDMIYSYSVAFFDADHNLVGCAAQSGYGSPIKPGEKLQLASAIVLVPEDQMNRIKFFQVAWYETKGRHF